MNRSRCGIYWANIRVSVGDIADDSCHCLSLFTVSCTAVDLVNNDE